MEKKEEIKKDVEEIKRVIKENEDKLNNAYSMLEYYNEDAYDFSTLEKLLQNMYDCVCSDYVKKISEHIEDDCFVYDKYYDCHKYNTSLDILLQSKNKKEFIQNFKEYVNDIEERVENEKEIFYKEGREEDIEDDE